VKGDYTLASPAQLTNATQTPPLGELFFNLTGKTTGLSSSQFQFEAWNTSNTGILPLVLQSGTVYPSYALNLLNYTYSSTTLNITAYTQLSNQTVTVNFGAALSNFRIYQSTGTIPSTPTLASEVLTLVVSDSGAGASTVTRMYGASGANPMPVTWTLNGGAPAVTPSYNSPSNTITLTGIGTWSLNFHGVNPVGTNVPSATYAMSIIQEHSIIIPQGQKLNDSLPLSVSGGYPKEIDAVTFSETWIHALGLPLLPSPSLSGMVELPIALDTTNVPVGNYSVQTRFKWIASDGTNLESTSNFKVRVIPLGTTVPNAFTLPWQAPASLSDLLGEHPIEKIVLLIAAIMFLAVILVTSRRRR
jgi:hypothetical protein